MAINKQQNKMVDDFLRNEPAASGFLGELDKRIATNRAGRRAAQQANRAIGAGAFQGASPFGSNAAAMGTNMGGAGGRAIIEQGMGPVRPVGGGQLALPSAGRGLPAVGGGGGLPVPAGAPGGVAVPGGGGVAVPGGGGVAGAPGAIPGEVSMVQSRALGPGARGVGSGGGATGAAGTSATRVAAQSADDLLGVSARAGAAGDAATSAAAASRAGAAAQTAGASGIQNIATKLGVNITKQGAMRGAGMAGAGVVASGFFDGLDIAGENSVADRGGTGAILGAGIGAGGAMALGIPHVAAAAAGGAILFGGYKALWGEKRTTPEQMTQTIDDTRETIQSLGQMYGIEGDAMSDILLQYEASTSMYLQNEDKEGLKAFMAGMGTQLPALMLQARDSMKAQEQERQRYDDMMQAQAQFAPIFERTLDRANQASQTAYQTANQSATYLDQRQPQLAALYRQTAAQSQASAANLQAAYARQMAQAPTTFGTTQELERQLAQQDLMNQQLAGVGQFP